MLLICPIVLHAQTTEEETYPTGRVFRSVLFNKKYVEIFQPEYDNYTPNADAVKFIKAQKGKFKIKAVMGFWCDDSKLHIPRMLKVLDEAKWDTDDSDQFKIFGVDENKKAGFEGFNSLNIQFVPTFIVYYEEREIGRIVETPKVSLEEDLVNIMKIVIKK